MQVITHEFLIIELEYVGYFSFIAFMKYYESGRGIDGMKLGALVICITLFVIGMSLFTWKHFAFSNSQNQKKLNEIQTYNQLTDDVRQAQINFKIQVQEWKNTLIRGHEKEDFEKYYELFSNQQQNVQKQL